jgi:KAP family P-loop domain
VEGAISEFAGESLGDIVGAFQKEKELLIRFRTELEEAIKLLPASGKKPTLIFFVDELDRCRPTFAVELLERVKHLFNVENLVFVLAIDKAQLEASTSAIYGNNINAAEYLRRFIDIDFAIPQVKGRQYTEGLVELFNLDALFSERAHPALQNDRDNFIRFFTALADVFQLSLRARERCFTRMRLVMDQTPKDHYLDPVLVALLVVLRAKEPRMFADLVGGEISAHDVMQLLARHPGGRAFVADRMGVVLEAYLMLADENEKRVADRHVELKGTIEAPRTSIDSPDRARELVAMCRNLSSGMRSPIKLRVLARKIDLAANVRD